MATTTSTTSENTPIHIAVLLAGSVQLLDVSPIDLFGMMTPEYLTACSLPQPLINRGVPMKITYVGESGSNSTSELTANAGLRVTAGLDDSSVAPGKVDIVLIPGPDPRKVPNEPVLYFVRRHNDVEGDSRGKESDGAEGVVDYGELQKKFPNVKWEDKRWMKAGDIWCSAGITNGLDMGAAYIRETWPGPTANAVLAMADVGGRDVEYETSKGVEGAWFGWQVLKALAMGKRR